MGILGFLKRKKKGEELETPFPPGGPPPLEGAPEEAAPYPPLEPTGGFGPPPGAEPPGAAAAPPTPFPPSAAPTAMPPPAFGPTALPAQQQAGQADMAVISAKLDTIRVQLDTIIARLDRLEKERERDREREEKGWYRA